MAGMHNSTTNFLLLLTFLHGLLTNLTRLDALVNNAAVGIPPGPLLQQMSQCFQTNATGPLLMLESFAPLLKKSTGTPRVVNVSSGGGSITKRLDSTSPGYNIKSVQYRASKAALNMVTACQVVEYGEQGLKVFAFCPGFTVSNLGPHNNAENGAQPTSEGAAPIVKILNGERDAEHGGFLHKTGQYPW
jgi:NAD(P)-dependent dehydrogenase (short-subunit alcohol dehydrogenase family)